jgi:hypothetical protein
LGTQLRAMFVFLVGVGLLCTPVKLRSGIRTAHWAGFAPQTLLAVGSANVSDWVHTVRLLHDDLLGQDVEYRSGANY